MTSIIVHGGAGSARPGDDDADAAVRGCVAAARAGHALLAAGGSALDAVVAAVVALEDDPTFNAGLGSVLNAAGEVETDASVMRGEDGGAGAVAALADVRNPVRLARLVMERTPHVLLVAGGARAFAAAEGVPLLPAGALMTARAQKAWQRVRAEGARGTVGAVARDAAGHVAAATSTGGTQGKLPGRVGDSAIIGAGTYADDAHGAVSCTGLGEAIIKASLARQVAGALGAAGEHPSRVAERALAELGRFGGEGGLIAVDAAGRVGFAFDTERMARAWVDGDGHEGSGFAR